MANKFTWTGRVLKISYFIRYFICDIIMLHYTRRAYAVNRRPAPRVHFVVFNACNNDAEEHYYHCTRLIYYVSNCPADSDRFDGGGSHSSLGWSVFFFTRPRLTRSYTFTSDYNVVIIPYNGIMAFLYIYHTILYVGVLTAEHHF